MKIKTSELSGTALDWAVAKIEGEALVDGCIFTKDPEDEQILYSPSTDWAQGGPIVEREWIELIINTYVFGGEWAAQIADDVPDGYHSASGPTPLIAAMRCYVTLRLGAEVDIPDELTQGATA